MKSALLGLVLVFLTLTSSAQNATAVRNTEPVDNNTLLWRISGNGLEKPTYLFGTIHMLCASQIDLSDSLRAAIKSSDCVYLELDMNNITEVSGVVNRMKMNGDTTLADLLTAEEYQSVKNFFNDKPGLLPFSMLEKLKPMLAASSLMEMDMDCDQPIAVEQLIMIESKKQEKEIKGLETMAFQMSIFDSIPYRNQARQLVDYVKNYGKKDAKKQYDELVAAYLNQQMDKLESISSRDDVLLNNFLDVLLYRRNVTWVSKLETLMKNNSLVVAVGAGHLPGDKGVINLLKKAGYTVEPVTNNMLKKFEKQL